MKPIDPSPTPWDHSTWGFYCDTCDVFFDLMNDGKVIVADDCTTTYEHKPCGQQARYIGYDHYAVRPNGCGQAGRDERLLQAVQDSSIIYYGPHPCDLCNSGKIVRGSVEQGFGDIRLDYPEGWAYPNHNWTEHRCEPSPLSTLGAEPQGER